MARDPDEAADDAVIDESTGEVEDSPEMAEAEVEASEPASGAPRSAADVEIQPKPEAPVSSPAETPTVPAPPALPKDRDVWWVSLISLVMLGALAPFLGVWEPWEATGAGVADAMREGGAWLKVRVPIGGDQFRSVAELPFGWWPLAATTSLFKTNEIGLRLPDLLLSVPLLALLFQVTRRLFGRGAAWFAVLSLLCMPLFTYHARFALGTHGVSVALIGYAVLSMIRLVTDPSLSSWSKMRWQVGAWVGTALAGLTAGVAGVAAPVAVLAAMIWARTDTERWQDGLKRAAPPAFVIGALAVVVVGWWRASIYMPEGSDLAALLVWQDKLEGTALAAKRPSFDAIVHQLGFGLFPLAAFLPLAFADLMWTPTREFETPAANGAGLGLAAWFSVAFLIPAIGLTYSHMALFLGAPAVAIAVGVYFSRALQSPPQPLLVVAAVFMLALLDSNLKHETHYLADTLVGGAVDAFPAKLPYFTFSRLLDFGLLAVLILYQGGLIRWVPKAVRLVVYPKGRARWLSLWCGLTTLIIPAVLFTALRKPLSILVSKPVWGRFEPGLRKPLLFFGIWIVAYFTARALWNWRFRAVAGRGDGKFGQWTDRQIERFSPMSWARLGVFALLGLVAVYQNVGLAKQLTTNFSQKDMLSHYQSLQAGDEPLYKYQVSSKNSSFYARDLEALNKKTFGEKAAKADRFFAIVPRDRLAAINTEFRRASDRNLPVLNNDSSRFLLVSNQLKEGEDDKNPIEHARVKDGKLPAGATPTNINFNDTIDLVGWQLSPKEPQPGSPLDITLFWRAKKKVPGNWKVFVHIDAAGQRIHGDHDPVEGLYPTSNWAAGDVIRDTHNVVVKRTTTSGRFTFYVGLFQGNKRMEIKSGAKDGENRARIGTVIVR